MMAWEIHSSPKQGFSLWRDREQGFWRVTRDYQGSPMEPKHDLNHPRSKKAALEAFQEEAARTEAK